MNVHLQSEVQNPSIGIGYPATVTAVEACSRVSSGCRLFVYAGKSGKVGAQLQMQIHMRQWYDLAASKLGR